MDNSVVIKGNKNGIAVKMDASVNFDELKAMIRDKFTASAKFFNNAALALSLEGRELSDTQEKEIMDIISEVTDINIVCLIDHDEERNLIYQRAVADAMNNKNKHDVTAEIMGKEIEVPAQSLCQFYKGTLRSGQVLETESSVVILGDVNPGGKVVACGNVIVLGSLKGNIFAGANGNENAFVVALDMEPMQIKIADIIARCSDSSPVRKKLKVKAKQPVQPKIAYVYEGNIYVEDFEQNVLEDIHL